MGLNNFLLGQNNSNQRKSQVIFFPVLGLSHVSPRFLLSYSPIVLLHFTSIFLFKDISHQMHAMSLWKRLLLSMLDSAFAPQSEIIVIWHLAWLPIIFRVPSRNQNLSLIERPSRTSSWGQTYSYSRWLNAYLVWWLRQSHCYLLSSLLKMQMQR